MQWLDQLAGSHEPSIRAICFFGIFTFMACVEIIVPCRRLVVAKRTRWAHNLVLIGLNTVLLRLVFPGAALGTALWAQSREIGLLNYVSANYWLGLAVAVVAMDLAIYLQHVMVHAVPVLWRFHRVHHADLDFDVTTGARFHPLELLLSMLIKMGVVVVVGVSPVAVVVFEVLLNCTATFNHANVRLPQKLDRALRWIVVTPDMHRVHHSVESDETNTNFGFNLPWWDRIFSTYRAQPRRGHEHMTIGIPMTQDPAMCNQLWGMWAMPFRRDVQVHPISPRSS